MKIERIKLAELRHDDQNARTHDQTNLKAIAGSLEQFGQRKPIVITQDNKVVAGNGTLTAAKLIGWTEIDCVRVPADWTADQIKAYALADNRTAELAQWDEQVMAAQLLDLQEAGFDIEAIGFDLIQPESEPDELEDELPEDVETRTKLGDLWKLGNHLLVCGDSTIPITYSKMNFQNEKYAVFTDPPYGFNYVKKSNQESIENDGKEFAEVISKAISHVSAETMFICGDAKTAGEFLDATQNIGKPKSLIVWVKPIQHRMHRFEPCHEFIWYWGHNGSPFYGPNVFESKRAIEKYHPTVKPVELVKYCLNSIEETNIVDMFGGSGTTLIACEQTNKKAFVIELDPKYCDVIIQRWENLTGKKAELVNASR
jgi:DNA modification methylase